MHLRMTPNVASVCPCAHTQLGTQELLKSSGTAQEQVQSPRAIVENTSTLTIKDDVHTIKYVFKNFTSGQGRIGHMIQVLI